MHVCMAKQLMSTRSWGQADESLNLPKSQSPSDANMQALHEKDAAFVFH